MYNIVNLEEVTQARRAFLLTALFTGSRYNKPPLFIAGCLAQ